MNRDNSRLNKAGLVARLALGAVAGALLLATTPAFANVVTNTYTYSGPAQLTWSQLFNIAQFDSTLGTLNSVTFDVTGGTNGNLTLTKLSAGTQGTVNAQFGYLVSVDAPIDGGTSALNANPVVGSVVNLGPMAQNAVKSTTSGTGTDTNSGFQLTTPADLALYIGLGTLAVNMSSTWGGTAPAAPPGNASWTITPNMAGSGTTGSFTVTYDYATPEPSTYALLCISLGVVGYARKRMAKGVALEA